MASAVRCLCQWYTDEWRNRWGRRKTHYNWALGRLTMFMAMSRMGNNDQDNSLISHGIVPQCWWPSSQPFERKILFKGIEVPAEGHWVSCIAWECLKEVAHLAMAIAVPQDNQEPELMDKLQLTVSCWCSGWDLQVPALADWTLPSCRFQIRNFISGTGLSCPSSNECYGIPEDRAIGTVQDLQENHSLVQ